MVAAVVGQWQCVRDTVTTTMSTTLLLVATLLPLVTATGVCGPGPRVATATTEDRVTHAPVVFRGLAVQTDTDTATADPRVYTAQFWLISVYKGSADLAALLHLETPTSGPVDIRDRRVNVSGLLRSQCWPPVSPQEYYVVLAQVLGSELQRSEENDATVLPWTPDTDRLVWRSLGWGEWMEWSACSISCGEGSQHRWRSCLQHDTCEGFNKETRRCNMFPCQGAMSPLSSEQTRFLHGQWGRAPDRDTAWRLRPSAYLWLPAAQLPASARHMRRHFALLITLRLNPKESAAGTLFSLRSRRQQNAYLSVELAGKDSVKLVHASHNGTQTVTIPAPLADGHWHHLAIGVQQDSSVRSYLDCQWISTDILRRDSLDIPEDADVVIGYLFSGDLEQLVVVPDPGAVSQQCATNHVSSYDPSPPSPDHSDLPPAQHGTTKEQPKSLPYFEKGNEIWQDDEDLFEASGGGGETLEQYEYQWTPWSGCSVTCGLGIQTRRVSCTNAGVWMDFCLESARDKTETRPCSLAPCSGPKSSDPSEKKDEDVCGCQNGGKCHTKRRSCHCTSGYQGRHCEIRSCPGPCLHGGVCHNTGYCSCPPEYTGQTCQIPVCRPPCMNGGQCVKPGVCSCPDQFNHPRCASMCPDGCEPGGACVSPGVCQCLPGYHGSLCQESLCSKGCLNGGVCVAVDKCNCTSGWTGADCSTPVCDPPCQRGGRCIGPQKCLCPPATHGPRCQNFTCTRSCMNGGVCVGPDLCECPANATGSTCARPLCDPPCENGATCAPGNTCVCAPHTEGTRCQTKNCDYRFVQEPYTRGFRKLVKRKVQTKCGVSSKVCLRTIAEYQTVYKTFYRTVYKCANLVETETH